MRLLVLPQTFHGGELHSLDLNASNELLACSGADGNITIWAVSDILGLADLAPSEIPTLNPVRTIACHSSAVRLVRWSPLSENILMSSDESGNLFLTSLADGSSEAIYPWASLEESDISPVADADWSADGRLLAWSTLDGKVQLFDTTLRTMQSLTGLQGDPATDKSIAIQRSVSFDPTNKFLVTIGDDTLINVYHYTYVPNGEYRFVLVNKISKLMSSSVTSINGLMFRRTSWSCDGEYIAVPNSSKQLTSVVSLLATSEKWENQISLVGHDMECGLAKFAPHIYQSPNDEVVPPGTTTEPTEQTPNVYHVIASAGLDNTLVLWNTSKESPLSIIRDISKKPIVDMAWHASAKHLIAATSDGKLVVATFSDNELGVEASQQVTQSLQQVQKISHEKLIASFDDEITKAKKTKNVKDVVSQNDALSLLELQKQDLTSPNLDDVEHINSIGGGSSDQADGNVKKQRSTGTVKPEVLSATPDTASINENADSLNGHAQHPIKVTRKAAPKPQTGIQEEQKVTTKNGKKRVQPILISQTNVAGTNNSESIPALESTSDNKKTTMEFEKPSYGVPQDVMKDTKRPKSQEDGSNKKLKRELEPVKYIGTVVTNPNTAFAKARLSTPKIKSGFRLDSDSGFLDIKNGQGNENVPSRITNFRNELQVWTDFIPQYIQLATSGTSFWAISTADGQIITYSNLSGHRLLPPIVLGSPLSFLESKDDYLLAVTSIAEVYVWDMKKRKILLKSPLSLVALLDLNNKFEDSTLSKSDNITMCSVTSKGLPLVTMLNGSGYIYNIEMEVWQTVSEAWWAFGLHYWDSISDDKVSLQPRLSQTVGDKESLILGLLEHKTNEELFRKSRVNRGKFFNKISKNMIMKEGFENLENTVSLSHLENRILCSELLGETLDFKEFLLTYAKRLCELGLKAKLFEVCETLYNNGENAEICGLKQLDLLRNIILACADHREALRVLIHFSGKLGMTTSEV